MECAKCKYIDYPIMNEHCRDCVRNGGNKDKFVAKGLTIEEKKSKVIEYCCNTSCEYCVLNDQEWTHNIRDFKGTPCLNIYCATEAELDKAIELIESEPSEDKQPDPIKPEYYNDTNITPFDVIDDWELNFYLGNAIKYIKRAGKKADNSRLQDLKKVREYIDHEIIVEEAKE